LNPKDNITLREERGNTFIMFLKERRKGDCIKMLLTPEFQELWWKLYWRAKRNL
jgi:hypothetical protein